MSKYSPEEQARIDDINRRWSAKKLELDKLINDASPGLHHDQMLSLLQEMSELLSQLPAGYNDSPSKSEKSESVLSHCTDRARQVFCLAKAIAMERGHADIEPADMFDCLLLEGRGVGANVLKNLDYGFTSPVGKVPTLGYESVENSAMVHRMVEVAREDAVMLKHNYVGTEHQLMALMRLHPELVPNAEEVRTEVLDILGHSSP